MKCCSRISARRSRSPEGAEGDSPGQRLGFGVAENREPGKGDTMDGSSLFRPFRAGFVLGVDYPGRCPGLSCDGPSGRRKGSNGISSTAMKFDEVASKR